MTSISRVLDRTLAVACIVLFMALTVMVSWQVFSRQVLGSPSGWTEEGARYTFAWLGFFGAAFVFSERGHIAVDFLIRRFPRHLMRAVLIFIQGTIITFAGIVFVYGGWRYSQQASGQQLSSLPFNVGQMFIVMPITGVLIIWYAIQHTVEALRVTSPIELLESADAGEPPATDPATELIVEERPGSVDDDDSSGGSTRKDS